MIYFLKKQFELIKNLYAHINSLQYIINYVHYKIYSINNVFLIKLLYKFNKIY